MLDLVRSPAANVNPQLNQDPAKEFNHRRTNPTQQTTVRPEQARPPPRALGAPRFVKPLATSSTANLSRRLSSWTNCARGFFHHPTPKPSLDTKQKPRIDWGRLTGRVVYY